MNEKKKEKMPTVLFPILYKEMEADFKAGATPLDEVKKFNLHRKSIPKSTIVYAWYQKIMGKKWHNTKPKEEPKLRTKYVENKNIEANLAIYIMAIKELTSAIRELNDTLGEVNWSEIVPPKKDDPDDVVA